MEEVRGHVGSASSLRATACSRQACTRRAGRQPAQHCLLCAHSLTLVCSPLGALPPVGRAGGRQRRRRPGADCAGARAAGQPACLWRGGQAALQLASPKLTAVHQDGQAGCQGIAARCSAGAALGVGAAAALHVVRARSAEHLCQPAAATRSAAWWEATEQLLRLRAPMGARTAAALLPTATCGTGAHAGGSALQSQNRLLALQTPLMSVTLSST